MLLHCSDTKKEIGGGEGGSNPSNSSCALYFAFQALTTSSCQMGISITINKYLSPLTTILKTNIKKSTASTMSMLLSSLALKWRSHPDHRASLTQALLGQVCPRHQNGSRLKSYLVMSLLGQHIGIWRTLRYQPQTCASSAPKASQYLVVTTSSTLLSGCSC